MDIEILTEVATQIVDGQIAYSWKFFTVLALLILVGGYVSAFFACYSIQRAKSYATKKDINDILAQIKKTTTLSENIKAEISDIFSYKAKLREKMEEVFWESYEYESGFEMVFYKIIDGKDLYSEGTTSFSKVEMLVSLYFPLAEEELLILRQSSMSMTALTTSLRTKNPNFDTSEYMQAIKDLKIGCVNFRTSLIEKYKDELSL
jgi:cell division protein FtsL